jgi:2-polyprenyl-3-methyl-5-hydroxy-6-metoxy-1,4-benzoquinol methylase
MTFDFYKFKKDLSTLKNHTDFSDYLESCFSELEEYLLDISDDEIQKVKFDIEDLLYDLLDWKLVQKDNSKIINAFLILLAEKFLQTSFIGAITIIAEYLPEGSTKTRLEASKLYLRVNDISKDYVNRSDSILSLIDKSAQIDEYHTNAIRAFLSFYQSALIQFQRVQNESLANSLASVLKAAKYKYAFLQDAVLEHFLDNITQISIHDALALIAETLHATIPQKTVCINVSSGITKEESAYAQTLYGLGNPTFNSIRDVSFKQLHIIGDTQELYDRLIRGEAIIDTPELLYKYFVSFGGKHKSKLYSAYDEIITKLQNVRFNIIDWGCGQGMATMVLLDFAKQRGIQLDIQNITMIEPSQLALSRALLHVDVLKQKEYRIQTINSDFDCLNAEEIICDNDYMTIHLFSNILDVENFSLDMGFMKKVSQKIKSDSIFVCVSPNRNDKLNNRLDLFYNYFDENFDTELIAARDDTIENATRYEKIFEVKVQSTQIVEEIRQEIITVQKGYQLDIIEALNGYSNYVVPILNMKILEDSINSDPEYAIFKIRKVAEVITSKIYSGYEDNANIVSFNDKIRYLAYEKKVFDKTITNYVQTIRTIGNRGVHEEDRDISKLKLDAHLMVIALLSFLNELSDKKLLN